VTPDIEFRVRNTAGAESQVETYIAEMDPGNTEDPRLTGNEGWNTHQLDRNETQMGAASRAYDSDRYTENEDSSGNGLLKFKTWNDVGTDDAYVALYTHEAARVAGPSTFDTANGPNHIAVVVDVLERSLVHSAQPALSLGQEVALELLVRRPLVRQDLDRDFAVQSHVASAMDRAHATAVEKPENLVVGDGLPQQGSSEARGRGTDPTGVVGAIVLRTRGQLLRTVCSRSRS